jgi:DNA-binding transcriptional regulator LsrR (DeoR family)
VEDHVLGVSLADLIAIPQVVGVASGRAKTPGVLGALRGHVIDSLVCDESLARSVLSQAKHTEDH